MTGGERGHNLPKLVTSGVGYHIRSIPRSELRTEQLAKLESADSTHYAPNPAGHAKAGLGQFTSQGEWFYACDELADGYGVKVNWHVVDNPSNNGSAWDQSSGGDCASSNGSIAEGKEVAYQSASPRTVSRYPDPALAGSTTTRNRMQLARRRPVPPRRVGAGQLRTRRRPRISRPQPVSSRPKLSWSVASDA